MPMSQTAVFQPGVTKRTPAAKRDGTPAHRIRWRTTLAGIVLTVLAVVGAGAAWRRDSIHAVAPPASPLRVTVSQPLQRTAQSTIRFLGQFSAVDAVELRAQVGGTLTDIDFKDGQIVHKGDQ